MTRTLLLLGLLASLAACGDGQPINVGEPPEPPGPPPTPPPSIVPEAIAGDLTSATFVPPSEGNPNGQLLVEIGALDTAPVQAAYQRNPDLDVPGFRAYSIQEDALDRFFAALAARSPDGTSEAVVAIDGGQFNTFYGGATFRQVGEYSPHVPTQPDNGLVSYAGRYGGLMNVDAPPTELRPVPPGTDPALVPGQPSRVSGDVFLNADFTDNAVNGAITNRRWVDYGVALGDVILVPADIAANGSFSGTAETPDQDALGTYAGTFGGAGASSAAGGVVLTEFLESVDNEEERGVFVLGRCGLARDPAICDAVDPQRD